MGLIKAATVSAKGTFSDMWKEYFYCDALEPDVLAVKGRKRNKTGNNKGNDNIITNGSVIAVGESQCAVIVEQGKVVDICAEAGEYTYDSNVAPSLISGGLHKETIAAVFKEMGKRFSFAGEIPMEQRIYYINLTEIYGNKFGTPAPVPFRVVDKRADFDVDIHIRCFGEYSYQITNPITFYTKICTNITGEFTRSKLDSQMKSELLMHLQEAFAIISEQGIRHSSLMSHSAEMRDALNTALAKEWTERRGIELVSFNISSATADPEDEKRLQELQLYASATARASRLDSAYANAMEAAANNANGAAMGFMGFNMAMNQGMGMPNMAQQASAQPVAQQQAAAPAADAWTCPECGKTVTGKFCPECGTKKPAPKAAGAWTCPNCGNQATGKFCPECGTKKPEEPAGWTCPNCGTAVTGKFCPECGTKKPEASASWTCPQCGTTVTGKFCPECGTQRS